MHHRTWLKFVECNINSESCESVNFNAIDRAGSSTQNTLSVNIPTRAITEGLCLPVCPSQKVEPATTTPVTFHKFHDQFRTV
eukprot:m.656475 g.656475  ORF g.656475 m.656475 type:complete len:82 (-) comp22703_c0_seq3:371-616(-)